MLDIAPTEAAARARLAQHQQRYPLPARAELAESFLQRVTVGELELFMVGLVAGAGPTMATGAAAAAGGFPIERAYFELIERSSLLAARASQAPLLERDRAGNGVALHRSWAEACDAALCELIERDRVLRSFAGEVKPARLALGGASFAAAIEEHYSVEAYGFDPRRRKLRHRAAGVFLWPRRPDLPLVYGFAAARDVGAAQASAAREALQRLAFLWGEALPSSPPSAAASPDYHQEHYLYPAHHPRLRTWLAGRPGSRRMRFERGFDGERARFIDLTPDDLSGGLVVAKACAAAARPLIFGRPGPATAGTHPHPLA
jgi:hypothetical protein